MKCSWTNVDLGWRTGSIYDMCEEAVQIAKLLDTGVSFMFNGCSVNLTKNSVAEQMVKSIMVAVNYDQTSVFV